MLMLDRELEHPDITCAIRTGYPQKRNYPERDDVEIIEIIEVTDDEIWKWRHLKNERKGNDESI